MHFKRQNLANNDKLCNLAYKLRGRQRGRKKRDSISKSAEMGMDCFYLDDEIC